MQLEWRTLRDLINYEDKSKMMPMAHWFYHNHPDQIHRLAESLSKNQLRSKENLFLGAWEAGIKPKTYDYENDQISIEIIGGWFGYPLLQWVEDYFGTENIKEVKFFEIDPFCMKVLNKYQELYNPRYEIKKYEMSWFDFKEQRRAHVIINTSCEHMPDMVSQKQYITDPERTTLFLTSNDKDDEPDHINCVNSLQELADKNDVKMLWGDSIKCEVPLSQYTFEKYYRHQVIGRWK